MNNVCCIYISIIILTFQATITAVVHSPVGKHAFQDLNVTSSNPGVVVVNFHKSPVAQRKRAVKHRHLSPRHVNVRI